MKSFINVLIGILIGVAAIIPGFSGGTIACVVGCYDELIESISGIRKHFKQSILTLLPFLLGIAIGALSIFPISWGINNYPLVTISLFAGLLIGSIPSFYQNIKGKSNKTNILSAVICGVIFLVIILLNLFIGEGNYVSLSSSAWWAYFVLIIAGMIGSAALVIPGISGSMVLMILGFYNPIMDIIKGVLQTIGNSLGMSLSLDFASMDFASSLNSGFIFPGLMMILCFGIGIILGFYLISKLMKYLLTKHKTVTYFAIFSFILVSLFGIYAVPSYYQNLNALQIVLAIVFLISGSLISYFLGKLADKKKVQ